MSESDLFAAVRAALGTQAPALFFWRRCDSTNTRARALAQALCAPQDCAASPGVPAVYLDALAGAEYDPCAPERLRREGFCVLLSEEQSAGRGRRSRSFYSPAGSGLYLSFLWLGTHVPADGIGMTTRAAVALAEAVREVCGVLPDIKWVNDLQIKGKKFAGILAEGVCAPDGTFRFGILGIGVDVHPAPLPEQLKNIVTCLDAHTRHATDRATLAAALVRHICHDDSGRADLMRKYRRLCVTIGQTVEVLRGTERFPATVRDVTDEGELAVELADATPMLLCSGEVCILPQGTDLATPRTQTDPHSV